MSTPVWGDRCKQFQALSGGRADTGPWALLDKGWRAASPLGRRALLARAARLLRGRSGGRGHGKTPKQGLVRVLVGQAQEQLPASASRVDFESK